MRDSDPPTRATTARLPSSALQRHRTCRDRSSTCSPGARVLTGAVRVILMLTMAGLLWWRSETNHWLETVWGQLRLDSRFQHDSFEPVLAVLAFLFWIGCFMIVDRCGSQFRRISAPYKLVPHDQERSWPPPGHSAWKSGWTAAAVYLIPIIAFDYFVPRRMLPIRPPRGGVLGLITAVTVSVLAYDTVMFFGIQQ